MGKAALESLAFTLAKEERRHGIHVNVVAPDWSTRTWASGSSRQWPG